MKKVPDIQKQAQTEHWIDRTSPQYDVDIVANPKKPHENQESSSHDLIVVYLWRQRLDDVILHTFKDSQSH